MQFQFYTILLPIALVKMDSLCCSLYNHSIRVHRTLHTATYHHSLGWIRFMALRMSTFPCLLSLWPFFGSSPRLLFFSVRSFFFEISRFFSPWIGFFYLWTLRCWCLLLLLSNKSKKSVTPWFDQVNEADIVFICCQIEHDAIGKATPKRN